MYNRNILYWMEKVAERRISHIYPRFYSILKNSYIYFSFVGTVITWEWETDMQFRGVHPFIFLLWDFFCVQEFRSYISFFFFPFYFGIDFVSVDEKLWTDEYCSMTTEFMLQKLTVCQPLFTTLFKNCQHISSFILAYRVLPKQEAHILFST